MYTYSNYLLEKATSSYEPTNIKFKVAKDDDFFYGDHRIIVFNKNDITKYKLEGMTAGANGHACKHLDELDSEYVSNIVVQVKATLIEYCNKNPGVEFKYFNNKDSIEKGVESKNPSQTIRGVAKEAILNFMDLVNDKVMLDQELTPVENKVVKFIKLLGKRYAQLLEQYVGDGDYYPIDSGTSASDIINIIKTRPVIRFGVADTARENAEYYIYLNLKNHLIMFKNRGQIRTAFTLDNSGDSIKSFLSTVVRRYGKRWRFFNRNILDVFKHYK